MDSVWKAWEHIWFADVNVRKMAALRIVVGVGLFLSLLEFWPTLLQQFASSSWLASVAGKHPTLTGPTIFLWFAPTWFVWGVYCGTLFAIVMFTIGLYPKWFGWFGLFGILSFFNRNPLLFDGDDQMLRCCLILLLFSGCDRAYCIGASKVGQGERCSVWPLRLIQFQIAMCYFVSGAGKLVGAPWRDGSAAIQVLFHPIYARFDLSHLPMLASFDALMMWTFWLTPWFELGLPLLFLSPKTRRWGIGLGVGFHLGLLALLHLRWFAYLMIALYLAFVDERWFEALESRWRVGRK